MAILPLMTVESRLFYLDEVATKTTAPVPGMSGVLRAGTTLTDADTALGNTTLFASGDQVIFDLGEGRTKLESGTTLWIDVSGVAPSNVNMTFTVHGGEF